MVVVTRLSATLALPAVTVTVSLELSELGSNFGRALALGSYPAILDCNGSVLDPAEFAQSLNWFVLAPQ
jgi:hypothetical protein